MSCLAAFRRLALPVGLMAALLLAPAPGLAAKPSEAEIQAKIDAEFAALEAQAKAERDAKEAEARARHAAALQAQGQSVTTAPPPPPRPPAEPGRIYQTVPIVLETSMGPITIALEVERAPLTAGNFLKYVDQKRLDGTQFYRYFTFAPDYPDAGLIQGGAQNDPKRILKPVPHEPTSTTGLTHDDGAVSLARGELGSGTADFFIIMGDMSGLDAGTGRNTADDQGFAVFGRVTQGMDIVRAVAKLPRSATRGEGAMKGQMLEAPIRIVTARRAPAP